MAQQKLTTPEELFHYQLRSALKMEEHSLEALQELHSAARDKKIKGLFSHHADETREQISTLHKVFRAFDHEATTAPSPATTGIKKQAASLIEKAKPKLRDQITLMSALGNEHFEISAYQGLILQSRALDSEEAAKTSGGEPLPRNAHERGTPRRPAGASAVTRLPAHSRGGNVSTNRPEEDLGATENDPLLDPLPEAQERQPRPDEVAPDEPLGVPEDPLESDPSRVKGDPAEDDM